MQVNIESPHISLNEQMTGLVSSKLSHLGKLFDRINHCHVVLRTEKSDEQKKCIISASMQLPGTVLFGEDRAETFEVALDKVAHDLEHQLRRYKGKLDEKRKPDML